MQKELEESGENQLSETDAPQLAGDGAPASCRSLMVKGTESLVG
ncbi:hypothetical protein [Lewinella sp. IMCC34191]|nr:hypothetical protein [Lewinella sp. IMCC34191]